MRVTIVRFRKIAGCGIALAILLVASVVYPQEFDAPDNLRAVVTATDAYIPQPAQIIAPGLITNIAPDPRGRYVLVSQRIPLGTPDLGEVNLLLYDSHTGRTKTVWQQAAPEEESVVQGEIYSITWFPDSDTAIASVATKKLEITPGQANKTVSVTGELLLIHAPPASRRITTILSGNTIVANSARSAGVAVVQVWDATLDTNSHLNGKSHNVHFITVDSRGRIDTLPSVLDQSYRFFSTSADGRSINFCSMPKHAQSYEEYENNCRYVAYDLANRKLSDIAKPESSPKAAVVKPPLALASGEAIAQPPGGVSVALKGQAATLLKPLYLIRSDGVTDKSQLPGSVLIAPHADSSLLLADNSAVLYQFQRTLYTVPLLKIPRAEYGQRVREDAIGAAKAIGTAMSMYASDYDGFLPLSSAPTGMSPYVGTKSAFNDPSTGSPAFRFLLDGQSQAGIKDADTRVAGYLDCVFGRATIYADGHVTWSDSH